MPSGILGARAFPDGCIGDLTLTAATRLRVGILELPRFQVAGLPLPSMRARSRLLAAGVVTRSSRADLGTGLSKFRSVDQRIPLGCGVRFRQVQTWSARAVR